MFVTSDTRVRYDGRDNRGGKMALGFLSRLENPICNHTATAASNVHSASLSKTSHIAASAAGVLG